MSTAPPIPRLWAVTDGSRLAAEWHGWCRDLAEAGVDAIQLREKDLDDRALLELARALREAWPPPRLLLVNRRLDVTLAVGADGVHLPADGLPVDLVRESAPAGLLVGRSTHSLEEIEAARDGGADYVFFGPVLPTPSKGDGAHGISSLGDAQRAAGSVPVIAIGGIDERSGAAAVEAGAHGVAAIRAFAAFESAAALARAVIGAAAREERR